VAHNLLGVDYGAKRVGVALAVVGERPQRLVTLANTASLLEELGVLLAAHQVETVVMGLPRNLDGDDTLQTDLVREFATHLQALYPQIVLAWQDEALTSEIARDRLQQQRQADLEAVLDQEAAVIILEDYLHDHTSDSA
jgi:putative Holliday junction resolvase